MAKPRYLSQSFDGYAFSDITKDVILNVLDITENFK